LIGANLTFQQAFEVRTGGRGMTEITAEVARLVRRSAVSRGIAHVFAQHTSCSIIITENADPSVLRDLEVLAKRWAPDGDPAYRHDAEGDDDMAAHARSVLAGSSVTVPIDNGELLLGTWQGIFLWEHRIDPHSRNIAVTVLGPEPSLTAD
jgi:secondary thiamine-phosphate synthase enzyme